VTIEISFGGCVAWRLAARRPELVANGRSVARALAPFLGQIATADVRTPGG